MTVSAFVRGTRRWSWCCALVNEFSQSRAVSSFPETVIGSGGKVSKELQGSELFPPREKLWRGQVSVSVKTQRWRMLSWGQRCCVCLHSLARLWLELFFKPLKVCEKVFWCQPGACGVGNPPPAWPVQVAYVPAESPGRVGGMSQACAHPGWAQLFPPVQASSLNLNYGQAPA